jgi:hypothetical protein
MTNERIVIGEQIVRIAEQEIGYSETPKDSNKTKFGEWFGYNGVAWCGDICFMVLCSSGV